MVSANAETPQRNLEKINEEKVMTLEEVANRIGVFLNKQKVVVTDYIAVDESNDVVQGTSCVYQ